MENFVSIYQNAISSDDCKYIIDSINSSNLLQGTMGGTVNTEMKDSLVSPRYFTDLSPISIIIGNALESCKEEYIKKHPETVLTQNVEFLEFPELQEFLDFLNFWNFLHCRKFRKFWKFWKF